MLLIYAHFSKKHHCGVVLQTVESELRARKLPYELWDLYAMDFNPVFNPEKYDFFDKDGLANDPKIRQLQEKIKSEKDFIVIYPTWWVNVPAILKGFFDRVLSTDFAFRYKENGFPEGLLQGRRALVITTAGGPWLYHLFLKLNRSLQVTTTDTLEFCGIKTANLLIGSCKSEEVTAAKSTEIQKKTTKKLADWL